MEHCKSPGYGLESSLYTCLQDLIPLADSPQSYVYDVTSLAICLWSGPPQSYVYDMTSWTIYLQVTPLRHMYLMWPLPQPYVCDMTPLNHMPMKLPPHPYVYDVTLSAICLWCDDPLSHNVFDVTPHGKWLPAFCCKIIGSLKFVFRRMIFICFVALHLVKGIII